MPSKVDKESFPSSEVATSSNACLGPMSPLDITLNVPAVPLLPQSCHVVDAPAMSTSIALGEEASQIKSQKRKGSVRDSPPRKFAFASPKAKNMQD